MLSRTLTHRQAVALALFVTLLWSSSWVLIKIGLGVIPALSFAGLRYTLAFVCLLPFALRGEARASLVRLTRRDWGRLLLLGVLFYAVTQGAQFLGLSLLPAITTSLALNFTSPLVALLGIWLLEERPTWLQWGGLALFLGGVLAYFYPVSLPAGQALGVTANALSSVLGRSVNRGGELHPLAVTAVSMGFGGLLMLGAGLAVEGLPPLGLQEWGIVAWLAVVNTALAFTLWNQTLRVLSAMESSIINGTMLIQIALLAWLFLGEALTPKTLLGLALAGVGAVLVQWRKTTRGLFPHPRPLSHRERGVKS